MSALALTDHGVMYGALDFYKACHAAGIKPIIGVEGYSVPSLEEKTGRYEYNHLLLLAREQHRLPEPAEADDAGAHARLPGAPAHGPQDAGAVQRRADRHVRLHLRRDTRAAAARRPQRRARRRALVSGCLRPGKLLHRDPGPRRGGIAAGPSSTRLLYDLAREVHAPLLATNDLHYVAARDAEAQDVLLCVQTGKTLEDPKRMKFDSSQYYLKTPDEMARSSRSYPTRCATRWRSPSAATLRSSQAPASFPTSRFRQSSARRMNTCTTSAGRASRTVRRDDRRAGAAARLRVRGHPLQGLHLVLPDRLGLRELRPQPRHALRGPRLGGGQPGGLRRWASPT